MSDAADFMKVLSSNPESIDFEQTMAVIGEGYVYTPTAFSCGEIASTEEQNQGSAKIFSFAKLQNLDEATTLQLFGRYYREDVLKNPEGTDHGNIRNFMAAGWDGVKFPNGLALKAARRGSESPMNPPALFWTRRDDFMKVLGSNPESIDF